MSKLGERLIRSANQALAHAKGEDVAAKVHTVPDVLEIRKRLNLTQPAFAARFGLPVGSVRDWEQRRTTPDGAARVLLRVIDRSPDIVAEVVAGAA